MFQKAEKRQGRLRVVLMGPSGSGKTLSALLIASGIGKKIAFIDTENNSAADYAHRFDFDVAEIRPPYTVEKYIAALHFAENGGYDVVVMDSISHVWAGEGGLLQEKEQLDSRGKGSSYTNWAPITKLHEQFKSMILLNKIHLIATMRSKQDYILMDKEGKSAPKKVGMAPIQREGMEYEFTVALDLAMDHTAAASKDRTGLFDGKIFTPTVETGKALLEWRMNGKAEALEVIQKKDIPELEPQGPPDNAHYEAPPRASSTVEIAGTTPKVSDKQRKRFYAIAKAAGKTDQQMKDYLAFEYGLTTTADITTGIYEEVCAWAEKK